MQYLNATDFLRKAANLPVLDVRSPGEFQKGHIPGAASLPMFSDDERAEVGTLYKQQGKVPAIDRALEFVQPKETTLARKASQAALNNQVMVYCWRGGMRSAKMAEGFEAHGLQCLVLTGGYKAYRNQLHEDFKKLGNLLVLQGPTGSGKTEILHELQKLGEQVIDLEGLAGHRGSAFGGIGMGKQPTTAQFQNNVHAALKNLDLNRRIWLESESLVIGRVYLPEALWGAMNRSRVMEIKMSRELRAGRIAKDYGNCDRAQAAAAIQRIARRFGGQHVKKALQLLEKGRDEELVHLLLAYYDKTYAQSRQKHKSGETHTFECSVAAAAQNAKALAEEANKLNP